MINIDWSKEQEAQEFARPGAGAYICRIVSVEDNPSKEYLKIYADIAEGEFKDYGKLSEERTGKDWDYIRFNRSYKPKARGFFKGFLTALEKSNRNFSADKFDGNEQRMKGMWIGLVLGEEEYVKKDGSVGVRTYVDSIRSGEAIRQGDYKIPELKKLDQADTASAPVPFSNSYDDCPF